ncbi:MAG: SDR family NAD(P)-dependent oxidoreductase [Thermodesulfobacteriota bacterium]
MNQLMGRTAIVTGGTGALGRAVTFELLTRGANVMCTYLKDEELDASFALRQSFGDRVVFGKADVARRRTSPSSYPKRRRPSRASTYW